jgi:hypothetical protein
MSNNSVKEEIHACSFCGKDKKDVEALKADKYRGDQ